MLLGLKQIAENFKATLTATFPGDTVVMKTIVVPSFQDPWWIINILKVVQ
jgi:hypothetical protein